MTGLRFFFALFVMLTHATITRSNPGALVDLGLVTGRFAELGYLGVTFFFALSGFVLTWSTSDVPLHAGSFYRRRFARVYPLHAATTVLAGVGLSVTGVAVSATAWPLNLLLVQAWVPVEKTIMALNPVSWSLACEAFFYLATPLLLRWAARRSTPACVGAASGLFGFMVAVAVVVWTEPGWDWVVWFSPWFSVGAFTAGMALALAIRRGVRRWPSLRVAAVGAGSTIGVLMILSWQAPIPRTTATVLVLPAVIVLIGAAAARDLGGGRSWLAHPATVRLGEWSFALYLLHWMVFDTLTEVVRMPAGPLLGVTAFVASVAASAVAHQYFERPLERWLRPRSGRTAAPSAENTAAPEPGRRYASLDGLRGIAAVLVLVQHVTLVSPAMGLAFYGGPTSDALTWWWVHGPLHLFWAGTEAVTVFFVLSGFVLTLPFLRDRGRPSWRAYYPQRALRLYLPVIASLLLAAVTYWAVDHRARPGMSWWMAGHDIRVTPLTVGHDAALLLDEGWLNSVLWSLRWEVLFSLALPVVVWLVVRVGRWRLALLVGSVLAIGVAGVLGVRAAGYLPMFGVGAVMAAERERLGAFVGRLGGWSWAGVVVVAVAALLVQWWPGVHLDAALGVVTVGAALLLGAFMWCPGAVALGQLRWVQWLGVRSFSLYLVHEPVVTTTALLLSTDRPEVVFAVAAPASLLLAAAFFRLVELPSQRWAKRAGQRFAEKSLVLSSPISGEGHPCDSP